MTAVALLALILASTTASPSSASAADADASLPSAIKDEPAPAEDAKLDTFFKLLDSELSTTTSTRTPVSTKDAPAIITVVPRAVIEARGLRSIADVLRSVPGLYLVDDHVTNNIGVRGINGGADSWSRIVKFLVDGRPMQVPTLGGAFIGIETIPIDAVEAVEVIRGPASALYGANAFLGVVNIITRSPTETMVQVSSELGIMNNRGQRRADAMFTLADAKSRLRMIAAVSAARIDRSGQTVPSQSPVAAQYGDEESAGDVARPMSAFARSILSFERFGEISATFLYQHLDAFSEFGEVSTLTHGTRIVAQNTLGRLDYTNAFDVGGGVLRVNAVGSMIAGNDLPSQRFDTANPLFILRRQRSGQQVYGAAEVSYARGMQFGLLGVDYQDILSRGDQLYQQATDATRTQPGDSTLLDAEPHFRYGNLGAYAHAMARPGFGLSITGGARYDHLDRWHDQANGRIAISRSFGEATTAKILYGTSYVPPAPSQLYGATLPNAVRNNPNLQPQHAKTVEAALVRNFSEHVSTTTSLFFTRVNDRIENVPLAENLTARNLTQSDSYGGELSVDTKIEPYFAQAQLSYVRSLVVSPNPRPIYWSTLYGADGAHGGVFDPTLPSYPALVAHVTGGVSLPQWWFEANATVNVATARSSSFANSVVATHQYTLPAYATVDLFIRSLELEIFDNWHSEVALTVRNLLDAHYAEPGGHGADIPQMRRSIALRFTVAL